MNKFTYNDVRRWCKEAHLTASQFAELSGKPKRTVIRWLKSDDNKQCDGLPDNMPELIASHIISNKSGS